MTVPGFPNFFMLYGPNTNLVINGSILIMVECQVRYVVEAIGRPLRAGHRTMSCRRDVHEDYSRDMEEGNAQNGLGRGGRPDLVPQRARRPRRTGPSISTPTGPAHCEPDLADYELA